MNDDRMKAAKDNAVFQAQIQAQEARTHRSTVLEILRYFGLPEHDWEALRLIRQRMENIAAEWDDSYVDAPGGVIDVGPALRCSFVMDATPVRAAPAAVSPMTPEGWKLVPAEATDEMLDSLTTSWADPVNDPDRWRRRYAAIWRIMVAAAPSVSPAQSQTRNEGGSHG